MAGKKKQEETHLKILRQLVGQPHNKKCFDCGQRGPTYANMTIGAFVCTSCSGFLRGINPPHRVKSISMASFTPQEIKFLQDNGNEVCGNTWLANWNGPESPHPESREEQKVKDFLVRKYERKMWHSANPAAPRSHKNSQSDTDKEPEAKPLKSLLGESTPQVVVATQKEQKSPVRTTSIASKAEVRSDLLGDLSGNSDPFRSTQSNSQSQQSFGVFQQPPPAQDQFTAFSSTGSFDLFAASPAAPAPQSTSNNFAASFPSLQQPVANHTVPPPQEDKYAALANTDLFKSSDTQSVFSSVFSDTAPSNNNSNNNTRPNPFMSPATSSSGAAVFQQQQQKPMNPFLNYTSSQQQQQNAQQNNQQNNLFASSTNQPQLNAFNNLPSNNAFASQQQTNNFAPQPNFSQNNFPSQANAFPQTNNFQSQQQNFNSQQPGNNFPHQSSFPMHMPPQQQPTNNFQNPTTFGMQPTQQSNFANFGAAKTAQNEMNVLSQLSAFGSTGQQQNAAAFSQSSQQNAGSFTQPTQQNFAAFSQPTQQNAAGFNQPSANLFSSSPANSNSWDTSNGQQFATNFPSAATSFSSAATSFSQQQQQQPANNFAAFKQQSSSAKKPPFGGIQMPGLQQHQNNWNQPQATVTKSTNPFL